MKRFYEESSSTEDSDNERIDGKKKKGWKNPEEPCIDSIFYNLVFRDKHNISKTRAVKLIQHLTYNTVFVFGQTFRTNKTDEYFDEFIEMMKSVFRFKEVKHESDAENDGSQNNSFEFEQATFEKRVVKMHSPIKKKTLSGVQAINVD